MMDAKPNREARTPRILVVDDEILNIRILVEVFKHGYEVFFTTNANEIVEMCHTHKPDLILLDIGLPHISGIEICKNLKATADTWEIPIIFVTARGQVEDEVEGFEAGAADFISKPFNPIIVRTRADTHIALKAKTDQLKEFALFDSLTGLANRRHFDMLLETEWRWCRRHNTTIGLFMIDVDHFKLFNDTYGHQAGDHCLAKVGGVLGTHFGRPHDVVARYGGEEFAFVVPGIPRQIAIDKGLSMVNAVKEIAIPHATSPTATVVTVSLGLVVMEPGFAQTTAELIAAADAELYSAKRQGRNRISPDR